MQAETGSTKKKRSIKKTLLWITAVIFIIIAIAGFFVYKNFNRLLTDALMKSFNSNIASDVYELKFEKLSVNLLLGNINVYNVELLPREKPLRSYPYINSSFRLRTRKIILANAELYTLIRSNKLNVDRIEIIEPDVQLVLDGDNHILLPFKDTADSAGRVNSNKRFIESFSLTKFKLEDASFHVTNRAKERDFGISKLNITLNDLFINQHPGKDIVSYNHVDLSIGEFSGNLRKKALKHISFKDFKIAIDSLHIQQTPDTLIFHFSDFSTGLNALDIQTADSIFHLTMGSFNLSWKERSIKLAELSFKPNISDAALQRMSVYQKAQVSATVGSINITGVNFDSLIYGRKVFINEITVDKASLAIFKDKRKPLDTNRFPQYLAQNVKAIPIPLLVNHVKATNANLVSTEIKPDGSYGKANINRGTLDARNITNLSAGAMLTIKADAYLENKAHAHLNLNYSYRIPEISFNGKVESFNLTGLNPLLRSFTPAGVKKGIVDEIVFSGNASRTQSVGTMKFLYHDLAIDLELHDQAKWKSAVLAFAANTYLHSSNPPSANLPARIVQFKAERNMNKGFINLLIKSVLSGLKETMIMSKENKEAYKAAKKDAKKEARDARRQAKEAKREAKKKAKKERE